MSERNVYSIHLRGSRCKGSATRSALCFLLILILVLPGTAPHSTAESAQRHFELRGFVVEAETEKPIEGASVKVNEIGFTAETNLLGFYLISKIPAGSYTITAQKAGYKSEDASVTLPDTSGERWKRLDFNLTRISPDGPPLEVQGFVYDIHTAQPIPRATVLLEGPRRAETRTGTDGFYKFKDVQPGKYTITATFEGYKKGTAEVLVKDAALFANIMLAPNPSILEGKITAPILSQEGFAEAPAKGVIVEATGFARGEVVTPHFSTQTREDGRYRFEDLPPAIYKVSVRKPGYEPKDLEADVKAGKVVADFDFGLTMNGAKLKVVAKSPVYSDAILEGLDVLLEDLEGINIKGSKVSKKVENGAAQFEGLLPGRYRVTVGGKEKGGALFYDDFFSAMLPEGSTLTHTVQLTPQEGLLKVNVVDPLTKTPIDGANLSIIKKEYRGSDITPLRTEFNSVLSGDALIYLPPGTYHVRASKEDYTDATLSVGISSEKESLLAFSLKSKHGRLEGRIFGLYRETLLFPDEFLVPTFRIADAKVVIGTLSATTDILGRFSIDKVPSGTHTVRVQHPLHHYLTVEKQVTILGGEVNSRDFNMNPNPEFTGTISTSVTWKEKVNEKIFLVASFLVRVIEGEGKTFQFEGLPPGNYSVHIHDAPSFLREDSVARVNLKPKALVRVITEVGEGTKHKLCSSIEIECTLVAGSVTDLATNAPVKAATVFVEILPPWAIKGERNASATTNAAGFFEVWHKWAKMFSLSEKVSVRINISAGGYKHFLWEQSVSHGGAQMLGPSGVVRLVPGGGGLQGKVVNPEGDPIQGVQVKIFGTLSLTDEKGLFHTASVDPGKYDVTFFKLGYRPIKLTGVTVENVREPKKLDTIKLEPLKEPKIENAEVSVKGIVFAGINVTDKPSELSVIVKSQEALDRIDLVKFIANKGQAGREASFSAVREGDRWVAFFRPEALPGGENEFTVVVTTALGAPSTPVKLKDNVTVVPVPPSLALWFNIANNAKEGKDPSRYTPPSLFLPIPLLPGLVNPSFRVELTEGNTTNYHFKVTLGDFIGIRNPFEPIREMGVAIVGIPEVTFDAEINYFGGSGTLMISAEGSIETPDQVNELLPKKLRGEIQLSKYVFFEFEGATIEKSLSYNGLLFAPKGATAPREPITQKVGGSADFKVKFRLDKFAEKFAPSLALMRKIMDILAKDLVKFYVIVPIGLGGEAVEKLRAEHFLLSQLMPFPLAQLYQFAHSNDTVVTPKVAVGMGIAIDIGEKAGGEVAYNLNLWGDFKVESNGFPFKLKAWGIKGFVNGEIYAFKWVRFKIESEEHDVVGPYYPQGTDSVVTSVPLKIVWNTTARDWIVRDYFKFMAPSGQNGTFLAQVYPGSTSSLAVDQAGNVLMVFVHDDASRQLPASLSIYSSFLDRKTSTWTQPKPLSQNIKAAFEPAVTFDAGGAAIAIWSAFDKELSPNSNPLLHTRSMELFYARLDPGTRIWSQPTKLTSNAWMDSQPILVSNEEGSLVAAWVVDRDGIPFTLDDTDIYYSVWDGSKWSESKPIVRDANVSSPLALSYVRDRAVLAYTRDLDGSPYTDTDEEIFYAFFIGKAWTLPQALTSDKASDSSPAVAFDGKSAQIAWVKSDVGLAQVLVVKISEGSKSEPEVIGEGLNIRDLRMLTGEGGPLILVWRASAKKSDSTPFYTNLKPGSAKWSAPRVLTNNTVYYDSISAAVGSTTGELLVLGVTRPSLAITAARNITLNRAKLLEAKASVNLALDIPSASAAETGITLVAKLMDEKGSPLPNANVTFYVNGSKIGVATTDFKGVASLPFTPRKVGSIMVSAVYEGSLKSAQAVASSNIIITPSKPPPTTIQEPQPQPSPTTEEVFPLWLIAPLVGLILLGMLVYIRKSRQHTIRDRV